MVSRILLLFAILFLPGCFPRLDITSTVSFSNIAVNSDEENALKDALINHAESLGGDCTQQSRGVNCQFLNVAGGKLSDANFGRNQQGFVYVNIHSTVTTVFGFSDEDIVEDRAVPDFHLEWEHWMTERFAEFPVSSKIRHFSNRNIKKNF